MNLENKEKDEGERLQNALCKDGIRCQGAGKKGDNKCEE